MTDAISHSWFARAVAAAIVESIWQGAAIALVSALLLGALRGATANARYLIACAALGLLAACWVTTMVRHAEISTSTTIATRADVSRPIPQSIGPTDIVVSRLPADRNAEVRHTLSPSTWRTYADTWAVAIVPIWLLGVCFFSVRLTHAWSQVLRLRGAARGPLPADVQRRITRLVQIVAVRRPIEIGQSALVQIPTVVGWLRPVVLLPASALAGLTPEQLDSIIAHELAHIRRHDFVVNAAQRLVEVVLFYHPACWWLSAQIREAREQCCDDIAVAACGDHRMYATALATLEELRVDEGALQLAATDGPLLRRIRRLVVPRATATSTAEWLAAIVPTTIAIALIVTSGLRAQSATPSASRAVPPDRGVIEGRIIDARSRRAITGATLELTGPATPTVVVTGKDGRYEVPPLVPGNYRVLAHAEGYLAAHYGGDRNHPAGALVSIDGGRVVSNIDIALNASAALSGRVLGPDGNGLSGVELELLSARGANGERRPIAIQFAQSEAGGEYRFTNIAPGDYWVRAYASGRDPSGDPTGTSPRQQRLRARLSLEQVHAAAGCAMGAPDCDERIRATYYPGVPHVDEASSVHIDAGGELFGTDFMLLTTPTHRVEGRLVAPGSDFSAVEVHLTPKGDLSRDLTAGGGSGALSARPTIRGTFAVTGVMPGSYMVMVFDRNHPSVWASTIKDIDVEDQDLRDVVIAARASAHVDGRIIADTTATSKLDPSGIHVVFELPITDGGMRMAGGPPAAADGHFSAEAASGDVRIAVDRLRAGWMVHRILVDGAETSGTAVFADGARHRVDVVLTDRLTHVAGRVVDKSGRSIPDARIVILPSEWAQSSSRALQPRPVPVGRDGSFSIDGLMPADYLAADITGLEPYELFDRDVLQRVSARATRFRLRDDDAVAIRIVGGEP